MFDLQARMVGQFKPARANSGKPMWPIKNYQRRMWFALRRLCSAEPLQLALQDPEVQLYRFARRGRKVSATLLRTPQDVARQFAV
ncbi:MAG: hypothetical protein QGF53_04585 [Alphaproteobacteria bacterium]|nr:hypothetical protein [Alphaproteobacteria bacterium]